MTQCDTDKVGNTKRQPCPLRYRKWCFTLNNYTRVDIDTIKQEFKDDKYCFQEEAGENKTEHLQGYVEFTNARTFASLKKKIPRAHWEKARNPEAAEAYCCKEETRIGEIFTNIFKKKIFHTKNFDELYPWQKNILTIIEEQPDDRTIHWFWEPTGCRGKTIVIKYILKHYPFATFTCATKSADILSIADEEKNIYLLNFTRSQEGFAPWNALEQLKDGLISDSKLKKKSRNIVMDSPHVICFANWPPDQGKLSEDRWKVFNLASEPDRSR